MKNHMQQKKKIDWTFIKIKKKNLCFKGHYQESEKKIHKTG